MSNPSHSGSASNQNPETIDLTIDSESSPPQHMNLPPLQFHLPRSRQADRHPRSNPQRQSHPTQISRPAPPEVIDLISDSDDDRQNSDGESVTAGSAFPAEDSDFRFLGARSLRPTPLPSIGQPTSAFSHPSQMRRGHTPRNIPPRRGHRPGRDRPPLENAGSSSRSYFQGALSNVFSFMGVGHRNPPAHDSATGFAPTLPNIDNMFRGTNVPEELEIIEDFFPSTLPPMQGLNYETPGFQMFVPASSPRARPVSPEYKAPPAVQAGYTRRADENDIIVCPRCGDELGVGSDPSKQQVWVSKQCGHVSSSFDVEAIFLTKAGVLRGLCERKDLNIKSEERDGWEEKYRARWEGMEDLCSRQLQTGHWERESYDTGLPLRRTLTGWQSHSGHGSLAVKYSSIWLGVILIYIYTVLT